MTRRDEILGLLRRLGNASSGELGDRLGISRQALHRHLRALLDAGDIVRTGKRRGARYSLSYAEGLAVAVEELFARPFDGEDEVYGRLIAPQTGGLPENIAHIVQYAFTELFNNAIDHADAETITARWLRSDGAVGFEVVDDGVGCFERIRVSTGSMGHRDALEQLSKGKLTSAPEAHTGEGIFFSSKAVSIFRLDANRLAWTVDNLRTDQTVQVSDVSVGTRVQAILRLDHTVSLPELMRRFTGEHFGFDRTSIHVRLFERGEVFMSRSEAKRILLGLEKFRHVILDFAGVKTIGQGFADEIFRVWGLAHPQTDLTHINASDDVLFMIQRAIRR